MRLAILSLAALACLAPTVHAHDDEKIKITIETDKRSHDDDEEKKPSVTLMTGTYDPRAARFGSLRQYTLASNGLFADYLKGDGPTKAEVFGVGVSGVGVLFHKPDAPVSPFLTWGWGVYHSRLGRSETKLAWRVNLGVETKVGLIAKLQLLDTKLQSGDLRGSSLMLGWRF
jgi:hypothetical protein